ncbi:MAG: hypothetical protein ACXQTR_01115 [Candidatus Methanospirareceae archaeon]
MIERIREALKGKIMKEDSTPVGFLNTGSTLLNLACSDRIAGGFPKGCYSFVVGDSASGKTFLSLTCLAEAARDSGFDDYRFIYDGVEGGAMMDIGRFFGEAVEKRIEPPSMDGDRPICSQTAEDFYYFVDDALEDGRKFVYILDSQDSLTSTAEVEKFDERKEAYRKGKTTPGSYGDSKAKIHSSHLRKILGPLKDSGSILIVLNQTRDSFDMFTRSTYSGGRALLFYATMQLWSSLGGKITKTIKGKKRQLGIRCKVQVKKNRITGKERTVTIPIYHSYGIDDVGSCVEFLVDEGVWKKAGNRIVATGLGPEFRGYSEAVIEKIEERDLVDDLRVLVGETWKEIEESCDLKRKRRYE